MPTEHAILSPSGAQRWLTCTPSAKLEEQFPDTAGAAASEGTLAHALGELLIRHKLKRITRALYTKELTKIQADTQYEHAMFEYAEGYAVFVLEQFAEAQNRTKDAVLVLEQRLDLTDYVPDGFGTGDTVIIADHVLDIIDLKYGKGVPVTAVENKQMMLYGLGALKAYDYMYDVHTVRMTIYQPRLDSITTFEMPVIDLQTWAENELKPRAELAFKGEGEFTPGTHCRFCKVRATCKANATYNLQLAKYEFADPALLSDDEVSDILTRSDRFINWIGDVKDHALAEAIKGKKWPGFKLVEGRSNRAYSDEENVAKTLLADGWDEKVIYNKKLVGITALEKIMGKDLFSKKLSDHIIKPPGKPTLVTQDDKRPEYNSAEAAKADFAELTEN